MHSDCPACVRPYHRHSVLDFVWCYWYHITISSMTFPHFQVKAKPKQNKWDLDSSNISLNVFSLISHCAIFHMLSHEGLPPVFLGHFVLSWLVPDPMYFVDLNSYITSSEDISLAWHLLMSYLSFVPRAPLLADIRALIIMNYNFLPPYLPRS